MPNTEPAAPENTKQGYEKTLAVLEALLEDSTQTPNSTLLYTKLTQLAHEATLHAQNNVGYEQVIVDAERLREKGHPHCAALLTFAAEQGHRNRSSSQTQTVQPRTIPPDTFEDRLVHYGTMLEKLEDAEERYENCRNLSSKMAYPLGMCVVCTHYHRGTPDADNSGNITGCIECECVKEYPATEAMNNTYHAYYALSVMKNDFDEYEEELVRVHIGDRWVVLSGYHKGETGCSIDIEQRNGTRYVLLYTDNEETFWVEVKNLTRPIETTPPRLFDPES